VLTDSARLKIYHFARFDLASIRAYLGVMAAPAYCTKTASRLIRTYTDRHGLKELVRELLGLEISKQQQSSDWGASDLNDAQKEYAASDVRYLHACKAILDERLAREGRSIGAGLFRFPSAPSAAGPRRLGRRRYFRTCLGRLMSELAEQDRW
jgi:ribonuclease D